MLNDETSIHAVCESKQISLLTSRTQFRYQWVPFMTILAKFQRSRFIPCTKFNSWCTHYCGRGVQTSELLKLGSNEADPDATRLTSILEAQIWILADVPSSWLSSQLNKQAICIKKGHKEVLGTKYSNNLLLLRLSEYVPPFEDVNRSSFRNVF
jgi:hypothetical protein